MVPIQNEMRLLLHRISKSFQPILDPKYKIKNFKSQQHDTHI